VIAGLAALVGSSSLPLMLGSCGGVDDYIDHYMEDVTLPSPPDSRHLVFPDGSTLSYRVELVVGDRDAHECLDPASDYHGGSYYIQVLEALDDVLRSHDAASFGEGEDLTAIEAELALEIHGWCSGHVESWETVLSLDLIIDEYVRAEPIQ